MMKLERESFERSCLGAEAYFSTHPPGEIFLGGEGAILERSGLDNGDETDGEKPCEGETDHCVISKLVSLTRNIARLA